MKIVILGGGFAGIPAAKVLSGLAKQRTDVEVILIDRNDYTTMLPSLPDVAGGQVDKAMLVEKIQKLIPGNVRFVKDTVSSIDLAAKSILLSNSSIAYDYLLLAAGSKTNFYGFSDNLDKLYTLENLDDSIRILDAYTKVLESGKPVNAVISGAGFTGIELACNLYRRARALNREVSVTLIEKFNRVLGGIPEPMVRTVENEAKKLGLTILKEESVTGFDGTTVKLASGKIIENAFFCWCSGVKQPVPLSGNHKKIGDDRVIVDNFLSIPEHPEVFVAGDAAAFKYHDCMLRRSVNYAAMQGSLAARNIVASVNNTSKKAFVPFDMGWVIPVNLTSVGVAMGVPVGGRLGILMHYFICGAKNYNVKNFLRYAVAAFKFALHRSNYPKPHA